MFVSQVLPVLAIICFCQVSSLNTFLPVTLQKKCAPTDVVRGPCHVCICDLDGIYQCKEQTCNQKLCNNGTTEEMLCEPNMAYKENDLICTCNQGGFWKDSECQEKFDYLRSKPTSSFELDKIDETCTPNSLYLIDCNICRCSEKGVIDTALCSKEHCSKGSKIKVCRFGDLLRTKDELCACSDINLYIDRRCINIKNKKKQIISEADIRILMSDKETSTRKGNENDCIPPKILKIDCNTCTCTEANYFACTNKMCIGQTILRSRHDKFFSLPVLHSENQRCIPGVKYRLSCNTCSCSPNRRPICTTMFCLADS